MRAQKSSKGTYWSVTIGVLQAVAISVLTAALGAVFIDNESIQINAIPIITIIAWFISSFLCAVFSGYTGEGRWALRSGIATGIYYLIMMSVGILVFDGLSGNVLYGFITGIAGFLIAMVLLVRKQKKSINRKMRNLKLR